MDAVSTFTEKPKLNGTRSIPMPKESLSDALRDIKTASTMTTKTQPTEVKKDGVFMPYAILSLVLVIALQGGALIWFLSSASKDIEYNKATIKEVKERVVENDKFTDTRFDLLERKMDKAEEKLKGKGEK